MKKKRFCILGIFLFSGFLNGSHASSLSHGTSIFSTGNLAHTTTTVITHYVPPPHTARHGYRHSYDSHELQFDTDFGAYMIIGNPGLYFFNGYYLRLHNNDWQISSHLGNPWHPAHYNNIPHRLREHHVSKKLIKVMRPKKDSHVKRESHKEQHKRAWH